MINKITAYTAIPKQNINNKPIAFGKMYPDKVVNATLANTRTLDRNRVLEDVANSIRSGMENINTRLQAETRSNRVKTDNEIITGLVTTIKTGVSESKFKYLGKHDAITYRFEVDGCQFDYVQDKRGIYSYIKSVDDDSTAANNFYIINNPDLGDTKEYAALAKKILDPVIEECNKKFRLGLPVNEIITKIPEEKQLPIVAKKAPEPELDPSLKGIEQIMFMRDRSPRTRWSPSQAIPIPGSGRNISMEEVQKLLAATQQPSMPARPVNNKPGGYTNIIPGIPQQHGYNYAGYR